MKPSEVEALDDDVYAAFVQHMEREARELERAAAQAKRGR
jgi:hypothetical protein